LDLVQRVGAFIKRHQMVLPGSLVVVAVSGGPDSVALLHILNYLKSELGISLHVAHLNHMFRGKESEEDARFVAELAGSLGLPFTVAAEDVPAYRNKYRLSSQVAAREVRYNFLRKVALSTGAARIALGHQADDQAETVLINFLRGAGPAGLKGMLPVRDGFFVRPLLEVRRAEIERFLSDKGFLWRQDSSNQKTVYTRNRLRLELIPYLEREYNPALVPALLRLAGICREEDEFLESVANRAFPRVSCRTADKGLSLDVAGLKSLAPAIIRRVVRRAWREMAGSGAALTFERTESVLELLGPGKSGAKVELPGGVLARREGGNLYLGRVLPKTGRAPYFCYPLKVPGSVYVPEAGCTITAEIKELSQAPDPKSLPADEALLDLDRLPVDLCVRRRQEGDVFWPLGQALPQKLKDFFIGQKVPFWQRDLVPLVAKGREIVWVGGIRPAEPYRVNEKTKRVLHLAIERNGNNGVHS